MLDTTFFASFIMNTQDIWHFITTQGAELGIKLATAIVAWIVGRWLIALAVGLLGKVFERGGASTPRWRTTSSR
jgi:ubiquinone biosynthesis protein Coq4